MAKMQAILKTWYDALRDDGKVLGMRCKDCGTVEFPPVPICNQCGRFDMEWMEMSGKGELISLSYSPMGIYPYGNTPAVTGYVRLKEGMLFQAVLLDVDEKKQNEIFDRMRAGETFRTKFEITKLDDTISYPCLRLVE